MTDLELLLDETVTETGDGEPLTLSYLVDGGPRTMKKPLRRWLQEYLLIRLTGHKVGWLTSTEVDETGGDLVRIWTNDLADTSLADDCDFLVWQMPDDTVGEDFVKLLSRNF
jgi:hypothetical protein